MTLNNKCNCDYSTKSKFDLLKKVDDVIKSIENETDMKKIAEATHECLYLMSLFDACQFMVEHQYPPTSINILKFKVIAQQSYLNMLKELILN